MYKTIFAVLLGGVITVSSFMASAFEQSFSQLNVRGTNNGWGNSAMTLVADHQWQIRSSMAN